MKVILHADDFGYDKDTTLATIELLESGSLTSASIMVTMPAAQMAMEYAATHPNHSYGVHLTYVDGFKPAVQRKESSLLDNNGLFYPSNDVRKMAITMKLKKQDIIDESIGQIEMLRRAGVKISHLDSHGHLHKFPSFLMAMPDILKLTGIEKARRVQNVFFQKSRLSPTAILNRCFDWRIAHICRTTDFFYMSANNMDTDWAVALLSQMKKLPKDAVLEVGVHPGHANSEKECWRIAEYHDICDFANKVRNSGKHEIINWNEL